MVIHELSYDQQVGEVFDRYAEPDLEPEILFDRRDRAIALACMIAYTEGHYDWPGILDGAMRSRGIETNFSSLPAKQQHVECHRASGTSGELTRNCTSLPSMIIALSQD